MAARDEALRYASRGWHVMPLYEMTAQGCSCPKGQRCASPGKHARIQAWQQQSSCDPAFINAWWASWPNAGVGIQTGKRSGFFAVDVDPRNDGGNTLYELERQHGELPETPTVHTGGGGQHIYFAAPDPITNTTNLFPGIDIKGENGFVVAPPTMHASGQPYVWDAVYDDSVPIADAPQWLLDAIAVHQAQPQPIHDPGRVVPQGGRHDFLLRVAMDLRRHGVLEATALDTLAVVNTTQCNPPQSRGEIVDLVADVWQRYTADITAILQTSQNGVYAQHIEEMDMEERTWIWEPFLIRNKLTLLDGYPGEGKSLFLMRLLADITAGRPIPGTMQHHEPMHCFFITIEDDYADTIKPRFIAAGGDPKYLHYVKGFYPITEMHVYESLFKDWPNSLFVFDPLFTYFGGDDHKSSSVLSILQPFTTMAEQHGVTVVGTRHLTKQRHADAMLAGQGSVSFAGVARSMLILAKDHEEDGDIRLVAQSKINLGRMGKTWRLRLEESPVWIQGKECQEAVLYWDGTSEKKANDLINRGDRPEGIETMNGETFLQSILADGPMPSATVIKKGEEEGISLPTLKRWKKQLGIISRREGKSWEWALPISAIFGSDQ